MVSIWDYPKINVVVLENLLLTCASASAEMAPRKKPKIEHTETTVENEGSDDGWTSVYDLDSIMDCMQNEAKEVTMAFQNKIDACTECLAEMPVRGFITLSSPTTLDRELIDPPLEKLSRTIKSLEDTLKKLSECRKTLQSAIQNKHYSRNALGVASSPGSSAQAQDSLLANPVTGNLQATSKALGRMGPRRTHSAHEILNNGEITELTGSPHGSRPARKHQEELAERDLEKDRKSKEPKIGESEHLLPAHQVERYSRQIVLPEIGPWGNVEAAKISRQ